MERIACYLVLALALFGTACAGRNAEELLANGVAVSPAEQQSMLDGESSLEAALSDGVLFKGLAGHPNCTLLCNDEKIEPSEAAEDGAKYTSCWGTFKAFCKGHVEKEEVKACFAGGLKCEGHYKFIKAPCGAIIAICEGGSKSFHVAKVKKEGKPPFKAIKAGGCLGKSVFVHAPPPNKSANAAPKGSLQAEAAFKLPAGMEKVWQYEGAEALLADAALHAADGAKTIVHAKCDGLGGGFKAFKKLDAAHEEHEHEHKHEEEEEDEDEEEHTAEQEAAKRAKAGEKALRKFEKLTFDKVEGKVNKTLRKLGVAVPAEPSVWDLDLSGGVGSALGYPKCYIACNGKPAWFKGALPCYGKFEVDCVASVPTPAEDPSADSLPVTFLGSCKGLYTGILGHKCLGFTTSHVAFKQFDKYGFCSGKHGMVVKKKKDAFGFGGFCKGKGLFAFQYTPEDDGAAKAQANEVAKAAIPGVIVKATEMSV